SVWVAIGAAVLTLFACAVFANRLKSPSEADEAPMHVAALYPILGYLTLGALVMIWSGVWLYYLRDHPPAHNAPWYWGSGFFFTGLALFVLGLAGTGMARSVRLPEAPPTGTPPANPAVETPAVDQQGRPIPPEATPVNTRVDATRATQGPTRI